MGVTAIGASVKRTEDIRFITGKGHYVDDVNRPGQAYAYFLRSPHAHATIDKIDTSAALKSPGVVAIFTGDDIAADKVGGLICGGMILSKDGSPMKAGAHPGARAGQGALCRRPCRRRDRRHAMLGRAKRPRRSRSATASCRRSSTLRRRRAPASRAPRRRALNNASSTGTSATKLRRTRPSRRPRMSRSSIS